MADALQIKDLIFRAGARLKDTVLLVRPLRKKEEFDLRRLNKYLSEEDVVLVRSIIKQKKLDIDVKKLGYTFMISGEDLLPILISDQVEVNDLNKKIEAAHYSQIFQEFKNRAWDILPYFIAPNKPGMLIEKRAAILLMLSKAPLNILLVGGGEEVCDFLSKFPSAELGKGKTFTWRKIRPTDYDYHLIFKVSSPDLRNFAEFTEQTIQKSTAEVNSEDIRFIDRYIANALKMDVIVPKEIADRLKKLIHNARKKLKITKKTVEVIVELVKASARLDLRSKVETSDLERVFDLVSKAQR